MCSASQLILVRPFPLAQQWDYRVDFFSLRAAWLASSTASAYEWHQSMRSNMQQTNASHDLCPSYVLQRLEAKLRKLSAWYSTSAVVVVSNYCFKLEIKGGDRAIH